MDGGKLPKGWPLALVCLALALALLLVGLPLGDPSTAIAAVGTPTTVYLPAIFRNFAPTTGAGDRFGIWLGAPDRAAADLAHQAGASWTNVYLLWSQVETSPGVYNFSRYDGIMGNLASGGVRPFVEIRKSPSWVASTDCGPLDKTGGMDSFANFVRTMVQRYSVAPYNVKHWEFYNEPDNTDVNLAQQIGMGCWGNYPSQYAQLLSVANSAVKSVDPQAKVVFGGLAMENMTSFNMNFLDQVLAAGGGPYFDVLNVHYFSNYASAWSAYGVDIGGKITRVRQIMSGRGVSKPVAVGETSYQDSPLDNFDAAAQARYVPKVLARALANDVYKVDWYQLRDYGDPARPYYYGLLDINGQPKPSYTTYSVAASKVGRASYVSPLDAGSVGASGGIEGYKFRQDGREVWVLWATPDGSAVDITLPGNAVNASDQIGTVFWSSSGQSTGYRLGSNAIYIAF